MPEGWHYPDEETGETLLAELQRELPHARLLFGAALKTFAARDATDDVFLGI